MKIENEDKGAENGGIQAVSNQFQPVEGGSAIADGGGPRADGKSVTAKASNEDTGQAATTDPAGVEGPNNPPPVKGKFERTFQPNASQMKELSGRELSGRITSGTSDQIPDETK